MTTAADPKTSGRFERRESDRVNAAGSGTEIRGFLDRVPQLREAGDAHQTPVGRAARRPVFGDRREQLLGVVFGKL